MGKRKNTDDTIDSANKTVDPTRVNAKTHPELSRVQRAKRRGDITKSSNASKIVQKLPKQKCSASGKRKLRTYFLSELAKKGVNVAIEEEKFLKFSEVRAMAKQHGIEVDTRKMTPEVRALVKCAAHAIPGATVCQNHGGLLPNVQNNIKMTMLNMCAPALARVFQIIMKSKNHSAVVSATMGLLDRSGFKSVTQIQPIDPGMGFDPAALEAIKTNVSEEQLMGFMEVYRQLQQHKMVGELPNGAIPAETEKIQPVP